MYRLNRIIKHIPSLGLATRTNRSVKMAMSSSTTVHTDNNKPSTAGIIIIGDEILKGHVIDTNSSFISKHLYSWGVQVKKISVIGDELDVIAKEVAEFSTNYTHVVTSGGVGPTHDDMTFEGVALAFKEKTVPHPELVRLIKIYFGTDDLKSPKMKMAYVPQSARLQYGVDKESGKRTRYPMVSINNVYMFPGIPSLLENALVKFQDLFQSPNVKFCAERIFVDSDEVSISQILEKISNEFKPTVSVGSYPDMYHSYYKVKLILESQKEDILQTASQKLKENLPPGCIIKYDENPLKDIDQKVYGLLNTNEKSKYIENLQNALNTIESALEKYTLNELCVGFNGGKDCTVLLHLVTAVVKKKHPEFEEKLKSLYIRSKLPFPEIEKYIQISRDKYRLEELMFSGRIKECMGDLRNQQADIKAVFMGTRCTDPYSSHLGEFSMTDPDWPQFMRINPLLEWSYHDIWRFLRSLCISYCSLYDRGYTSIGSMNNTHPNPSLQYIDNIGTVCYKPAYKLEDSQQERDGRN